MKLKSEFESIDGVKKVVETDSGLLKVMWEGNPSNYKSDLREIRNNHNHTVVDTPEGEDEETSDFQPIQYIKP